MQTPGPGTYNTTEPQIYKDKSPQFSMTSRNVMPGDTTQKPGPGAHSPENVRTQSYTRIPDFLLLFDVICRFYLPESNSFVFQCYITLGTCMTDKGF
jgi:hypothetical protein